MNTTTYTERFTRHRKSFIAELTHIIKEAEYTKNQEELSILAQRVANHGNQTLSSLFRDCWLGRR